MKLKEFLGKEYVEIEENSEKEDNRTNVEVHNLERFSESEELQEKIRSGSVLLLNVRNMKAKSVDELKRSVEKIKKTCLAVNGDIAGISEDWLVVCPKDIKIRRKKE